MKLALLIMLCAICPCIDSVAQNQTTRQYIAAQSGDDHFKYEINATSFDLTLNTEIQSEFQLLFMDKQHTVLSINVSHGMLRMPEMPGLPVQNDDVMGIEYRSGSWTIRLNGESIYKDKTDVLPTSLEIKTVDSKKTPSFWFERFR